MKKKEDEAILKIGVTTPEDHYVYFISVYKNSTANISVIMNNRSSIRYDGQIEAIIEK